MTTIFLNLPTADLERGSAFFTALGWERNAQFSDDTAASHVVSDTIVVMLLTHEKFDSFLKEGQERTTHGVPALYCLSADSRDAVDALCAKAAAAGGSVPEDAQDYGFMYGRSFSDPDGHAFEVMWMDPAVLAGGEVPQVASA